MTFIHWIALFCDHFGTNRAALVRDPSLIDLLVTEKSCDINAICFEGQTLLLYAVQVESIQVARWLMELGADQMIKDFKGQTPFTICPQFIKNELLKTEEVKANEKSLEPAELDPSELTYQEEIGEGATAVVNSGLYRIERIAIKDLDLTAHHSEFNREIKIFKNLTQPILVLFVGLTTKHKMRLVTELCLGGSLYDIIHERSGLTLSSKQVVNACRGTWAVQNRDSDINVKIADFGISRIAFSHTVRPKAIQGTGWWMSPEMLFGDFDDVSEKSDIYSFGV